MPRKKLPTKGLSRRAPEGVVFKYDSDIVSWYRQRMRKNPMPSITEYPIFYGLSKEMEISPMCLAIMCIIYHYEWATKSDIRSFGFKLYSDGVEIKMLLEKGYVQRIKRYYVCTYSGVEFIEKFFTTLKERVVSMEKQLKKTKSNTMIKRRF